MLKLGVLFLQTPSGGVLMDIGADQFLALSHFSASVWSCLSKGHTVPEVIDTIAETRGMTRDSAESLLSSQLRSWERNELINTHQPQDKLPQLRIAQPAPSREHPLRAIESVRLHPRLLASIYLTESKYRRTLRKRGLGTALKSLQGEWGSSREPQEVAILRTLRSYHASRRIFRQGPEARDCLVRSLGLATVLRRQGIDAQLCIGIVDLPFSSHAWVEAAGCVLNEALGNCQGYGIIGRF